MDCKVPINQQVLLYAVKIYEHLVTERTTTNQSNHIVKDLIPIKNHIIKAIQKNKTIVMGTQQTGELIVCLIVSLKVDKKKADRQALLRELKNLKTGYIKASADEEMAIAYIQSIEKKLGYHA